MILNWFCNTFAATEAARHQQNAKYSPPSHQSSRAYLRRQVISLTLTKKNSSAVLNPTVLEAMPQAYEASLCAHQNFP